MMRSVLQPIVEYLIYGGIAALMVYWMGYAGTFLFWFLALAFPFGVSRIKPHSSLFFLVLPGIFMGFILALITVFKNGESFSEAIRGLVALPALCFLLSWLGALPFRVRNGNPGV